MRLITSLFLATFSLCALAGGTATIEADTAGQGSGVMDISWTDRQTVRFTPRGQPGYMLVREGKLYGVTNAAGKPMVMDMSSLAGMGGQVSTHNAPGERVPSIADARALNAFEATGRSETVAGVEGEVYEITWTDTDGQRHTDQAVLSDDPRVQEMSNAFSGFADTARGLSGDGDTDPVTRRIQAENLGVLSFGGHFRVTALSGDTPPAGDFELPAEPQDLSRMIQGMKDAFSQ